MKKFKKKRFNLTCKKLKKSYPVEIQKNGRKILKEASPRIAGYNTT
jgi:hypothetical protein